MELAQTALKALKCVTKDRTRTVKELKVEGSCWQPLAQAEPVGPREAAPRRRKVWVHFNSLPFA